MNKIDKRFASVLMVSALFAMCLAPVAVASGSNLAVQSSTVSGNTVVVTVVNTSSAPETAYVMVHAVVDGVAVKGYAPVAVAANGSATATVGFTSEVASTGSASIIEGGDPF